VHAGGDASGAEVSRALTAALLESDVEVIEHATVEDVLVSGHPADRRVTGVRLVAASGEPTVIRARAVVLATGGAGGLYATTTNPPEVAGAGLGLALRAGATLVDLEFVQFHPTALRTGTSGGQVPLITEALRGEGATLRDELGRAVMAGLHPLGDLAPRDVVARRIDELVASGGGVWLDATGVRDVTGRFPTIAAACRSIGIDPQVARIPVVPTQHFMCGGVRTDTYGATDVAGLYAVGEVAATGVHGANRLASNSLVEGLAFGRRVAAHLAGTLPGPSAATMNITQPRPAVDGTFVPQIRRLLSDSAGIRRTGTQLTAAAAQLAAMPSGSAPGEAGNEWLAAAAIVAAAAARRESRGCHWRSDHPEAREAWKQRRVLVRLSSAGMPMASTVSTHQRERQLERTA
jgi:L-aspartate oxidase